MRGRFVGRTDSANLASLNAEVGASGGPCARRGSSPPPSTSRSPATAGQHARVALKRGAPGQARLAIAALFSLPTVKHAFIVDEDVDVFSDDEMEWAMATRFRADRDMIVATDMPGFYADPTADQNAPRRQGGLRSHRAGRPARHDRDTAAPCAAPDGVAPPRLRTCVEALEGRPEVFRPDHGRRSGSRDGREVALALDALRERGVLTRLDDGEWALKEPDEI